MSGLPDSWACATLGEVSAPGVDQRGPQTSEFTYIDISSIDVKAKKITTPKRLSADRAPSRARQNVRVDDIVVSLTRPNLNAVALITPEFAGSVASTGFHIIRPLAIEPRWIYFFVQSRTFVEKLITRVQGVVYPAVRPKNVVEIQIPLPPLAEQRRIVAEIEKQFTRLEDTEHAIARSEQLLTRYRASLFKSAFHGKLVTPTKRCPDSREYLRQVLKLRASVVNSRVAKPMPARDQIGLLLPEGWCLASADEVCAQITDGEHIQPPYQQSGFPMLSATHVRNDSVQFERAGLISEEAFELARKRCAPGKGDVLIVSVGATTGRAGKVDTDIQFAIVRSVLLLKPLIDADYLLRWIQSPFAQTWIRRASGASAQAHLYIRDIKRLPIPFPPELVQKAIAMELERRISMLNQVEKILASSSTHAARLRQAILAKAFSGQLVSQDPNDEPVSVLLDRIRAERGRSGKASARSRRTRSRMPEPALQSR